MSYRAPPAVLPSLRDLDAEVLAPVSEFATEPILIEGAARDRAASAPCPAFTIGPDLRGPRSPRPPRDLSA